MEQTFLFRVKCETYDGTPFVQYIRATTANTAVSLATGRDYKGLQAEVVEESSDPTLRMLNAAAAELALLQSEITQMRQISILRYPHATVVVSVIIASLVLSAFSLFLGLLSR